MRFVSFAICLCSTFLSRFLFVRAKSALTLFQNTRIDSISFALKIKESIVCRLSMCARVRVRFQCRRCFLFDRFDVMAISSGTVVSGCINANCRRVKKNHGDDRFHRLLPHCAEKCFWSHTRERLFTTQKNKKKVQKDSKTNEAARQQATCKSRIEREEKQRNENRREWSASTQSSLHTMVSKLTFQ